MLRLICLFSKKITLVILSIFILISTKAQVYYVSSSQGNDLNDGLSIQSPFQSIEKLNSMHFNPGDSIYFKSGDYWEGMFWLNSSGSFTQPIVIDVYGGNIRPIINGFGYQAAILIFNDQHIHINGLELYNSFSHLDSNSASTISVQTPSLFSNGPNTTWTNVYTACQIGDGNNGSAQTFVINVTSLPSQGANYRVVRTVANQNWYFAPAQVLSLGLNTITVPAVSFDRAVKFQFSSGDVEFDALTLNGVASTCVANTTSIERTEHDVFLNTFPNPTNGELFIESNDPIEILEIKDLSGKVVLKMTPQKNMVHIHTLQLKNSLYFLSCLINNEWVTRKIILNQR